MIVLHRILNVYDIWKHKIKNYNWNWNIYGRKIFFVSSRIHARFSSGKWGSQTSKVKDMYDVEIREARRIIDDTAKDRATAELRAKRAEEETAKFKDKYETLLSGRDSDRQKITALQKQLADNEADLNLFRRRLGN